MNKDKELEEAIEILNKFMNNEIQKDKLERDSRFGGWKIGEIYKYLELNKAIETVLQELDKLQQKEKSRIIGNIYEIKIEDLEPVLKPYYIPKKKIENEIEILKAQCGGNVFHIQQTLNAEIRLLQELLEGE